jgi:benzoylformate decarboxylase
MLKLYIYREPERALPDDIRIVQLDCDPREIGKNFPVEVGIVGDIKCGLAELNGLLHQKLDEPRRQESRRRLDEARKRREAEREALAVEYDRQREVRPMTPITMMTTLAKLLPKNAVVVEEAITTHHNLLEKLDSGRDPSGHFAHRGWALGWGIGCALGVKLAWPDRPVVGLIGDGSALYGIQGLWSAAHHRIPVTFVICNNAQYKILKVCGDMMPLPRMQRRDYLGMDLLGPEVDFVKLAQAFGVEAVRVVGPDDFAEQLRKSLHSDAPSLIDVPISR